MNQMTNENNVQEHHDALEKTHHSSHRLGSITILLIFGLFGLWSIFAKIETTITAQGKVISQSYNKSVMHPQGGIVKEIFIKEGDFVKKDQALLKIDDTEQRAQLSSNVKKHDTNLFLICRYKAQSDLEENLNCSEYEKKLLEINYASRLKTDVQSLFNSDMNNLQAKINLLKSQNDVLRTQNSGLEKQIGSNKRLLMSFERELTKWKKLLQDDAIDELKIIETQRQVEQSNLEIGILQSRIAENIATIEANNQQIELERETFKNIALTKYNELELENKLIEDNIVSLRNIIENAIIKAPSDGLITDMKIHTSGEVVSPQKQIMTIVPNNKKLIVEAYVLPTDIEKLYKEQNAEISFPAFVDPSAIPIEGKLIYISADAITPENEKESYYTVLLEITPEGFNAIELNGFKIIPGMPSAVFIKTGKTTLMEYLMQPLIQMFKGIYHAN